MSRSALLFAAGVPAIASAIAFMWGVDRRAWFAPGPITLRAVAIDMLLIEAILLSVIAPLAGVALASGRALMACTGTALLISAAITTVILITAGGGVETLVMIATTHATLGAAAIALGALGLLCGWRFRDPLDASACSVVIGLAVNFALLAAGPAAAALPTRLVNVALAASPVVATMSAAGIDILRNEVLYRVSPIAHLRFEYPDWSVSTTAYLLFAMLCFSVVRSGAPRGAPLAVAKGSL
jgi:hypothetical protein